MFSLFSFFGLGRRNYWWLAFVFLALTGLSACGKQSAPPMSGAEPPPPAAASPAPTPAPGTAMPPPPKPAAANGSGSHEYASKQPADKTATDGPAPIPQFDWPPPKASAEESIPDKWLRTGPATTLANVADKFEKALRLAHYGQRSYYAVPRGFALATQIEQIKADGTPMPGADRWKVGTPSLGNLSLANFIKALAFAPAGYYRAIVFVVTDAPWVQSATPPSEDEIKRWAGGGAQMLPASIGNLPYAPDYRARALIYEFRKGEGEPAETVLPSKVSGEAHLEKGGIWEPLSIL